MSKRILSMVLMLTLVLGSFSMAFADTTDTNAALTPEQKIDRLVELGFVEGHEGSEDLKLNDTITRAQSAVVTAKAAYAGGDKTMDQIKADIEKLVFYTGFTDVKKDNWATPYINAAVEKGIIVGFPDNTFKPQRDVKNKEIVTMMVGLVLGKDEKLTGNYPTNYITKAMDLGLLDGVKIEDYDAPATRQTVFEILFNAVAANKLGEYNVDKVIVLENNRVESIDANEIVVEVIKEVQRSGFVSDSRKEGSQYKITVPAKIGEVEDLLGKVIDLSYDSKKISEAVAIKVDDTYKYESGSIVLKDNKLEVDGKSYTVSKAERFEDKDGYKANDERIFNTYINNEAFTYSDLVAKDAEKKLDFGRVTIKNGKVLFIDAFAFDDIAPVKEVTEDGSKVTVYNDMNDGGTKRIEIKDEKVVSFKSGLFSKIDKKDIKPLNVIHVGKDTKGNQVVVVRQDAQVDGEYEKVEERIKETVIVVDGVEYELLEDNYKQAVYSYDSEEFRTLEVKDAAKVLEGFKKEKVTVLQDVNGNLQSIQAKIDFGEFVGLVDRVVGKEVKILKGDNNRENYSATIDSEITKNNSTTAHSNLNAFAKGDIVFVSSNKSEIDVMTELKATGDKYSTVTVDKDLRFITATSNNEQYRVFGRTNVFVKNTDVDGNIKIFATTLEKVRKELGDDATVKRATIITDEDYMNANPNYIYTGRDNALNTIVFEDIDLELDTEEKVVELFSITSRYDGITVKDSTGKKTPYTIGKDSPAYTALKDAKVKEGDLVTIGINNNNKEEVLEIERLADTESVVSGKVTKADKRSITLDNGTEYFIIDETKDFTKNGPIVGQNITLYHDARYIVAMTDKVVVDGGADNEEATNFKPVTFVEVLGATQFRIEVEGKIYIINDDTIIRNEIGKIEVEDLNQMHTILNTAGAKVSNIEVKDGNVVTSLRYKADAADKAAAQTVINMINALGVNPSAADVTAARNAYNALSQAQENLVSNLAKLEAEEKKINDAAAEALLQSRIAAIKATADAGITDVVKTDLDLVVVTAADVKLDNEAAYTAAIKASAISAINTKAKMQALVEKVNAEEEIKAFEQMFESQFTNGSVPDGNGNSLGTIAIDNNNTVTFTINRLIGNQDISTVTGTGVVEALNNAGVKKINGITIDANPTRQDVLSILGVTETTNVEDLKNVALNVELAGGTKTAYTLKIVK